MSDGACVCADVFVRARHVRACTLAGAACARGLCDKHAAATRVQYNHRLNCEVVVNLAFADITGLALGPSKRLRLRRSVGHLQAA